MSDIKSLYGLENVYHLQFYEFDIWICFIGRIFISSYPIPLSF